MEIENEIKQRVREFYDDVGWHEVGDGLYQNARYEDLRPVSREYIHRCHLRVNEHLQHDGRFLLDAGSGPIQYPEYLEYSKGYKYRVCADISIKALIEARKRIGSHGLFVVADIAFLPFKSGTFDGVVSLHTIHHLPMGQHVQAYKELYRLIKPERSVVVVNGWHDPSLGRVMKKLRRFTLRVQGFFKHRILRQQYKQNDINPIGSLQKSSDEKSTFVEKNDPTWFKNTVGVLMSSEILVWRSISVKDLRTFIHDRWGGRKILSWLFWIEDRFPHWFGEHGQYPLVVIRKH
jgi:ubiquinone/menaquinone biosynthesis C-methylase UbiE